jgi:hypothetical protein
VEAPEGSGCGCWAGGGCGCFGRIPEVEGVSDECGVLVAGDVLKPELGGEDGGSGGAGGATGGAVLAGMGAALVFDGPRGWRFGTQVQLYWNSGTVSSFQSRTCRYLRFPKWSTVVAPYVLTVQRLLCH